MRNIAARDINTLVEATDSPAISIHMPTERAGRETEQNATRFKNLLGQVKTALAETMDESQADAMTKAADDLLRDRDAWQHQTEGLAVFMSASRFDAFNTTESLDDAAVVGRHFHVLPLLPLRQRAERIFVLRLSQNKVQLLRVEGDSAVEEDVADMPSSFEDLAKYIDDEKQLQFQTHDAPQGIPTQKRAGFHGHGAASDDAERKGWLEDFCRDITSALKRHFEEQRAPLVLLAAEPLRSMFTDAFGEKNIASSIEGNRDHAKEDEIVEMAREALPDQGNDGSDLAGRFHAAASRNLTETRLGTVIENARHGRIDTLLVQSGMHAWGEYEPDSGEAKPRHGERVPGDEDLLNVAAVLTLRQGGHVHLLDADDMPGRDPLGAIFRY